MNINELRGLLGLPDDDKYFAEIDVDGSDFAYSECCIGEPHPACVHIDWWSIDYDRDTDAARWGSHEQDAFCWEHAIEFLADIVEETAPFMWEYLYQPWGVEPDDPMVKVVVSRTTMPQLVDSVPA
ncbi:hypothetical protein [Nocardia sp. NPDC059239]|uniref:hypothetical protein n=1 Tax=unclassified Nocardia TaxID=2637762 RepID=UPI0036B92579